MGSRIECFWIEPVEFARSALRRYEKHSYDPMPPHSCPQNRMRYHDTEVVIEEVVPYPFDPRDLLGEEGKLSHDDPRWPKVCHVCGTPFRDEDHWQHNLTRLFKGAPDGKLYTTRTCPPGGMFNAKWWNTPGPDGITLAVILPPQGDGYGEHIWIPDSPSKQGTPWKRTGTIPKVTCTPSVQTPEYHGFLTDGWLIEC